MRDAVGDALVELGQQHENIVVLDADLGHSTRAAAFGQRFPDRYFEVGIAEQNMVGMAAGLAAQGKVAFCSTFAIFGSRAWEQIRLSVAYSGLPVKFLFTHAGLATGPDGASHQMTEDLAIMAAVPGMKVFSPSDYTSALWAIRRAFHEDGPVYVRLVRPKSPDLYFQESHLSGTVLHGSGKAKLAIISTGLLTSIALEAQDLLRAKGVEADVYDVLRIKPLQQAWLERNYQAMVVAEDHVEWGGLFSAVARGLVQAGYRSRVRALNAGDGFGESGSTEQLYRKFGFTPENLARIAEETLD